MIKKLLLTASLLTYAIAANAATVNVIETLDALQWATGFPNYSQNYIVEQGDTVNFDIKFANNESIKMTSLNSFGGIRLAMRNDTTSNFTISNLNVLLTDYSTSGTGSSTPSPVLLSSGVLHLGPTIFNNELGINNVGEFIQFSGFQVSFLVADLNNSPSNLSQSYPGRFLGAAAWDVEAVPTIPVPAAVWLFGTALIGLVGFGKRRSSTETRYITAKTAT